MSKFSPYAALCNIFRNSEAAEQPEVPDENIEQSDKQVDTTSFAVNFDPKKISMINNSCQTQPLRDYSIDKVIPNYKQRQKTIPQPLRLKASSKDDNFKILRPSYAAFTGEKPFIELQNNVKPSRRPTVLRTPKITIPRRTITAPKLAPPIEIAYNPLVNTNRIKPRHVITVDRNSFLNQSNLPTNQNSSKNCQNILLNQQKQPIQIKQDNYSILRNSNINAVYKTVSAPKEAIHNGNISVDSEIYDKCICRDCGTLAVLSDSLKHPISYDVSPPYKNAHNETCTEKPETEKKYSSNKKHRSRSRVIAEAYSILEGKLELMEHRLQELEILCQHYEKINANHSGLTFDIYTQCTHDDNDKYQINYENSEVSIQNTPNCEINFETSEINMKGCHFPLFNLPRNIADKFKKQKHGKTQVHLCPRHLEEQSIYMCSTVNQNLNPTNDKKNDQLEEKPTLRSHEYLYSKNKQENRKMKLRSSKLSTTSAANSVGDKLDNFDFNLFTEQEVRDLLIYIRERNTNKKERFESSRKQASTQVLFRNKMKQPIRESTPNLILEETTGHLEHFDEISATTFQDLPTDSFQESSQQNFFLDSRIGDQHDPFDYVRFLNTKIQEKIYNDNTNSSPNKNFMPTVNALHNTKQFFRKNETVTLDKNTQSNFLQESNTDNMQLRGTKLRLNTPNNNFSNRVNLLHNPLHNSQLTGTKINYQTQPKNLCKKESIDIDSMMYKLNDEISYLFNKFHNTGSSKHSTKINTMYTNNNLNSNTVSNASTFFSEFEIPEKLSSCNPVTSRTSGDVQFSPFETENENFNLTKTARASTDFTHNMSSGESKFESEAMQNSRVLTNFAHCIDSKKPKLVSDSSVTLNTEIFTPKKILLQHSDCNTLNICHDEQKIRPMQCYKTTKQNISSQNTTSTKVTKPYVSKIPKAITPKKITNTSNNSESTKNEEEPLSNATTTSKSLNISENKCKPNNKTKYKTPLQKKTTNFKNKPFAKNSENSTVNDLLSDKPQAKTEQQAKRNNAEESEKKLKILNKFDLNSKFKQTPILPTAKKVKPSQPKKVFNQNTTPKLEESEEPQRAPKVEKQKKKEYKKKTSETKQKFVKKIRTTLSKNYISSKTSIRKFFQRAKTSKIFFKSKIPVRSFNRQVKNHTTLEEKKNEDVIKKSEIPKKMSSKSEITATSVYNKNIAVISEEPNNDVEILKSNNSENDLFEIANIEQIVNINCVMFTIDTMLLNTIFPFEDSSDEEPMFTELVSKKNVNFTVFKPEENIENLNNTAVVYNRRNSPRQNVVLTVQTVILNNINPTVEKDEVCLFTNLKSAMNILLYQESTHSDLTSSDIENTAELMPVNQAYNTGNFVILNMSGHRISAFSGIPANIRQSVNSRSNLVIPYATPLCDANCSENQFSFEDVDSDDTNDSFTERVIRRPTSFVKRLKKMFANAFRDGRKHCHDRSCPRSPEVNYYVHNQDPQRFQSYQKPCEKSAFRSFKDYVGAKVFRRAPNQSSRNQRPLSFTVIPLTRPSHNDCACSCEHTQIPTNEIPYPELDNMYPEYDPPLIADYKEPVEEYEKIEFPTKFNYCCLTRTELGMDMKKLPSFRNRRSTVTNFPAGPSTRKSNDIEVKKAASRRSLYTNSGMLDTDPSQSTNFVATNSGEFPNYRNAPSKGVLKNLDHMQPYQGRSLQNPEFLRPVSRNTNGRLSINSQNPQSRPNVSNRISFKNSEPSNLINPRYNERPSHNYYEQEPQYPTEFQPTPSYYNQRPSQNSSKFGSNIYPQYRNPSRNSGTFLLEPSTNNEPRESVYFEPTADSQNEMYRPRTSNGRNSERRSSSRR